MTLNYRYQVRNQYNSPYTATFCHFIPKIRLKNCQIAKWNAKNTCYSMKSNVNSTPYHMGVGPWILAHWSKVACWGASGQRPGVEWTFPSVADECEAESPLGPVSLGPGAVRVIHKAWVSTIPVSLMYCGLQWLAGRGCGLEEGHWMWTLVVSEVDTQCPSSCPQAR